jgi:hypothetical protein
MVARRGIEAAGGELGVAAILYTYRCTIACRHCGFGCSPRRPDRHMSAERFVANLRQLHRLGRVVHVAGGEAMMYWPQLREALAAARAAGVSPHFIETNASFAVSDRVARARLEELKALGVAGLLVSTDPFHQVHVPPANFLRLRRLTREVFGEGNFWGSQAPDARIRLHARTGRDPALLRKYIGACPPVLEGTAFRQLARFYQEHPLDELPLKGGWVWKMDYATRDCRIDWARETMWEIHIDPYDNILTNCGIILGRATETTVSRVMRRGPANAHEIARVLAGEGPFGLARLASERHGYRIPERARTKCGLCYAVRSFLRPFYPDWIGPEEIY